MADINSLLNSLFNASPSSSSTSTDLLINILNQTSAFVNTVDTSSETKQIRANITSTINTATNFLQRLPTITPEEMQNLTTNAEKMLDDAKLQISSVNEKLKPYIKNAERYIEGLYDDSLDIIAVHTLIVEKLAEEKELMLEILQEELKKYDKVQGVSRIERLFNETKMKELEIKIMDLVNDIPITKYMQDVTKILDEFKTLAPLCKIVDISGDAPKPIYKNEYRRFLINDYINVAQKYYDLRLDYIEQYYKDKDIVCHNCGLVLKDYGEGGETNNNLNNLNSSSSNNKSLILNASLTPSSTAQADASGGLTCLNCGYKIAKTSRSVEVGDARTSTRKASYDHEVNFTKFINRILCINNPTIDDDVIRELRDYFDENAKQDEMIPTCYQICELDADQYGRRGPYAIKDMFSALKKLGYNHYDPDVNYLTHLLWNWKIYDSSHIYTEVMNDRAIAAGIFEKIKHKYGQTSNMNNWFLSFRLLEKNGYQPCQCGDFKINKAGTATIQKYEAMWVEICQTAGWGKPKALNFYQDIR